MSKSMDADGIVRVSLGTSQECGQTTGRERLAGGSLLVGPTRTHNNDDVVSGSHTEL